MHLGKKFESSKGFFRTFLTLIVPFRVAIGEARSASSNDAQFSLSSSQYKSANNFAGSAFSVRQSANATFPSDTWISSSPPINSQPKLRVMMLGLRGFPNVQGGIEVHAENLCPLLVSLGCDVEVLVRSAYQPKEIGDSWQGVKFNRLWAPKSKGFEALLHTFIGVLYAAIKRPDILHIHAIGPAVMTPLARLLGLKVVVTHHGPDYNRQKWGFLARNILLLGEAVGMRFSNGRIVISNVIRELVLRKHVVHSELIHNGVFLPSNELLKHNQSCDDLDPTLIKFGLNRGRYVLLVSRLVPEKRHLDLIQAFTQANIHDCKLVLVGASDHPDAYMEQLLKTAESSPSVVMAGYQTGEILNSLYANAGLYVLPSSHEGLSISLLEALSHGLPVIASDIPANLELGLPDHQYFSLGDIEQLQNKMVESLAQPNSAASKQALREWVGYRYDWKTIARKTLKEYRSVMK